MTRWLTALTLLIGVASALAEDPKPVAAATPAGDKMHPRVKIETSLGDIVLELDAEKAPVTVLNFIRYAEDKHYDGTIFHRVIKTFMIQGGGYTLDMDEKKEGLRPGIKNEWQNGLKNVRGTVSMARLGGNPDSATAQFFINVVDNARLDAPQADGAAYAVFGKVVEGTETVDKIRDTAVTTHPKYPAGGQAVVPSEPVVIKSVKLVGDFDRAAVETNVKSAEAAAKETAAKAKAEKAKEFETLIKKIEDETKGKVVTTDSGLMYVDLKVGEGNMPKKTDKVSVHYTGWLTDGTKFDSSVDRGTPYDVTLTGGVIQGWLEGIPTMKVGGKRKLIIPSDLAYGKSGRPSIPPNATLIFDVELLEIK